MNKNMLNFLAVLGFGFLGSFGFVVAEESELSGGERVLEMGASMVESGEIVSGSCWDFIHAAYTRAGYPIAERETVFKGSKSGVFADVDDIQPGDWLYHVNHSYNNVEHSGVFVQWVDKDKKIGTTLSYQGEGRQLPGRYNDYDLKSVYNIMRPKGDVQTPATPEPQLYAEVETDTSTETGKFVEGQCSADLQMSQNLKAPATGEGYVRNGKYH